MTRTEWNEARLSRALRDLFPQDDGQPIETDHVLGDGRRDTELIELDFGQVAGRHPRRWMVPAAAVAACIAATIVGIAVAGAGNGAPRERTSGQVGRSGTADPAVAPTQAALSGPAWALDCIGDLDLSENAPSYIGLDRQQTEALAVSEGAFLVVVGTDGSCDPGVVFTVSGPRVYVAYQDGITVAASTMHI